MEQRIQYVVDEYLHQIGVSLNARGETVRIIDLMLFRFRKLTGKITIHIQTLRQRFTTSFGRSLAAINLNGAIRSCKK
jgi:hypothetical protein